MGCVCSSVLATQGKLDWAVLVSHEIYWKPKCEVSMLDLQNTLEPLGKIQTGLLFNLIVAVGSNFIVAIACPFWVNHWNKDDPVVIASKKSKARIFKYVSITLKMIPAILTLSWLGDVFKVLTIAINGNCADPTDKRTIRTFTDVEGSLDVSYEFLWGQVGTGLHSDSISMRVSSLTFLPLFYLVLLAMWAPDL